MREQGKVLACVDRSPFAQAVADGAAWAALRLMAPMELLHVIDRQVPLAGAQDHSGAIGPDAQEHLLQQLTREDEARTRAQRDAARSLLDGLRQRARAAGAEPVDVRLRHGTLDETVRELQADVRLVVLGRGGAGEPGAARDLGRSVDGALRAVARPLLVVPRTFAPPCKALFAFDGSAAARRGAETLAASPLLRGVAIHLLMSGTARQQRPALLEAARAALAAGGWTATASLQPGEPETVIAQAVRQDRYDLLVTAAYSRSPLRAFFLGSRATELLRSAPVTTLLLR